MQVMIFVLLGIVLGLLVIIFRKLEQKPEIDMSVMATENDKLRHELTSTFSTQRLELQQVLKNQSSALDESFSRQNAAMIDQNKALQALINEKLDKSLSKNFEDKFKTVEVRIVAVEKQVDKIMPMLNERLQQLQDYNEQKLTKIQETLDSKTTSMTKTVSDQLAHLQETNEKKLGQIQHVVDEQLQDVLQKRINQSFELVNNHLESVQKGLGEMRTLASDVGGLKTALTGVKTRGIIGKIQLSRILEQIFTNNQYVEQATIYGGQTAVDFAIKLPGKNNNIESPVYLPIDSKFPIEDYQRLQESLTTGNINEAEKARKELHNRVKSQAASISNKYIQPPITTNYAMMFLPAEGLYAEIVSDTALIEELFNTYQVNVAGPSTITAMLNSLQIGFRTLQIEQKSSQVWVKLSEVKTEFAKYADALEKVHDRIKKADQEMVKLITTRTNAMTRKLRDISIDELKTHEEIAEDRLLTTDESLK
jgi:DNA recombination protein RmuC